MYLASLSEWRSVSGTNLPPAALTVKAGNSFDFEVNFTKADVGVHYVGVGELISSVKSGDNLLLDYSGLYRSTQSLPRHLKLWSVLSAGDSGLHCPVIS
jgi:hypothetical protein